MSFRQEQTTISEKSNGRRLNHYIHLFFRYAWYIIPSTLLVIIGWFISISLLGIIKPQLEATAILQFEDPKTISAIDQQIGVLSNSKAVLIKSRSFLEEVAEKLSLQVNVKNHSRSQIFDSISVGSNAPEGSYQLKFSDNIFTLIYTNSDETIKNKVVLSGSRFSIRTFTAPGLFLKFTDEYLKHPFNIRFFWVNTRLQLQIPSKVN